MIASLIIASRSLFLFLQKRPLNWRIELLSSRLTHLFLSIENQANVGASNLNNATAIGFLAQVNQSNALVPGAINGVNGCALSLCKETAGALGNHSVNVGIGTTTPSSKLHVVDAANTGIRIVRTSAGES